MSCTACEEAARRAQTAADAQSSNVTIQKSIKSTCSQAKTFIATIFSRQSIYYNKNKFFAKSLEEAQVGSSPDKIYKYFIEKAGNYYAKIKAVPLNNSEYPIVVGYIYFLKQGNKNNLKTFTQIGEENQETNLITKDEIQLVSLKSSPNYSLSC
jgi:hypothetical protein